jgi:hypothetical protein
MPINLIIVRRHIGGQSDMMEKIWLLILGFLFTTVFGGFLGYLLRAHPVEPGGPMCSGF